MGITLSGCKRPTLECPDECRPLDTEDEWVPVWCDEFEESEINPDKWTVMNTAWGGGNNEAQYYRPDNVTVSDGNLIITAKKEKYGGKEYTSGRLNTQYKGDWLYGKVVVRAKLPGGRGTWSAIWMLPTDYKYGGWPNSGEIDIMEYVGYDPNNVVGTIHTEKFNHMLGTQIGRTLKYPGVEEDFVDYSMIWEPGKITLYADDVKISDFAYTPGFNQDVVYHKAWPFDQRFHLILNLAIGGNWGGARGIDDSIFPVQMVVDYVRVYQKDYAYLDEEEPEGISEINTGNGLKNMIYWKVPKDDQAISHYEIYVDGNLHDTTRVNSYVFDGLKVGQSYNIEIAAVDFAENRSKKITYQLLYQ